MALGRGVLDSVLQVDVRVRGAVARAGRVEGRRADFMGRQGRRDGVRRGEELGLELGGRGVSAGGIARFRDVYRVGLRREGSSNVGDRDNGGRRHGDGGSALL